MRHLVLATVFLLALQSWSVSIPQKSEGKFEFSKSVYKVKGTIKKVDGDFVIVPEGSKDARFIPVYLPDEYKKSGIEVTFDGDLGKADKNNTPLNIHKIWVAFETKEKYKLVHKQYELN